MTLNKDVYRTFEDIVGSEYISDEPAILDSYAWRYGAETEWFEQRFEAVLLPKDIEEIQAIVKLCNKCGIKFKASSTGWGTLNNTFTPGVIKLDLRRLNRIVEINERNMYAVVEPYVISAQLQAELMKMGFNCNTIGAGGNCTAHPFAAHAGIGHMGETTGLRERNILGTEWVTPEGEIVRFGSLGSIGEWFCGDGPGPSLRGVVMGAVAPMGGLGVFVKAATKIYHWPGPADFQVEGISPNYSRRDVPPNMAYFYFSFPSSENMIEAQRKIGESEIAFEVMGFNAAMLASNIAKNNEEDERYFEQFRNMVKGPGFQVIIAGNSKGDFEYKNRVLTQIIEETNGESLKPVEDPDISASMLWRCIRISASIRECFRAGGAFTAAVGGTHPFAEEVRLMEKLSIDKKDLINKGLLRDDGGSYLTWSHELGHLGHGEMILQGKMDFDTAQVLRSFNTESAQVAVDLKYGITQRVHGDIYDRFGPYACNFHQWLRNIKNTFDPNEVSESSFYISGSENNE